MLKLTKQVKKETKTFLQMLKCLIVNTMHKTTLPPRYPDESVLRIGQEDNGVKKLIPKQIWMYWEHGALPKTINAIISQIKKMHPTHEIHILNNNTFSALIPELSFKGQMPIANKTDIIRLELLYRYGGIWLDCTTILGENLEWVHEAAERGSFDIIGYFRQKSTTDLRYPVVESWLLAASPQNAAIGKWLKILSPLKDLGSEAYFEKMKARDDYNIIKQNISTPSYLLVYLAGQIALRQSEKFSLYLKKCEDSAFYLQEHYGWVNYKMNYVLCRLPTLLARMPIIKLTSGDRMLVEMLRKFGLIKRNSTIGELLYNHEKQSS